MQIAHESLPQIAKQKSHRTAGQVNNNFSKALMKSAIWHISTKIVPEELLFQKIKCRDIFLTPQAIVELFANYLPDHSSLQQHPFA